MKTDAARRIIAEWLEARAVPSIVSRDIAGVNVESLSDILAIVGPRRAGKTFFMLQLIQDLLAKSRYTKEDILFVDFEDYRLADFKAPDVESLLLAFNQLTGRHPSFLFFDEIQHLPGWSRVLRTLHNQRKYRIVVSGSNSELLSREISTELRGRYRDVLMLPFSFKEVLRFKSIDVTERMLLTPSRGRLLRAFDEYLKVGGFPEVLKREARSERTALLQGYYHTIFYKDILDRHNIKAKYVLEAMMQYCLSVYSDLFSISSFEKVLKTASLPGSKRTISNYLQYIEEAFFLIVHDKFSYSPRKRIMNPKKVYLLDVGFSLLSTDFSENRGKVLENVVAVELFRRKMETFYHKGRAECDFVVKQGMKCTSAIQVCWELTEKTKNRELNGVVDAMKASGARQGLVLTYDDEATLRHDGHSVAVMPVWRWLLREEAD
jgi:hypothetical protein